MYELPKRLSGYMMLGLINQFCQILLREMFDHFCPCPFLDLLTLDVPHVFHECIPAGWSFWEFECLHDLNIEYYRVVQSKWCLRISRNHIFSLWLFMLQLWLVFGLESLQLEFLLVLVFNASEIVDFFAEGEEEPDQPEHHHLYMCLFAHDCLSVVISS